MKINPTLPPIRSRPSNIVTCIPFLISTSAHRRPAIPPPTMATRGTRPAGSSRRSMSDDGVAVVTIGSGMKKQLAVSMAVSLTVSLKVSMPMSPMGMPVVMVGPTSKVVGEA